MNTCAHICIQGHTNTHAFPPSPRPLSTPQHTVQPMPFPPLVPQRTPSCCLHTTRSMPWSTLRQACTPRFISHHGPTRSTPPGAGHPGGAAGAWWGGWLWGCPSACCPCQSLWSPPPRAGQGPFAAGSLAAPEWRMLQCGQASSEHSDAVQYTCSAMNCMVTGGGSEHQIRGNSMLQGNMCTVCIRGACYRKVMISGKCTVQVFGFERWEYPGDRQQTHAVSETGLLVTGEMVILWRTVCTEYKHLHICKQAIAGDRPAGGSVQGLPDRLA